MKLWVSSVVLMILCVPPVLAQTVLRVPEDYETIQEAVNAAVEGDTIRVGSGTYCGAVVTKRLTIIGEGQPIITGCDGSSVGLELNWNAGLTENASGTVIQHLNFSGLGSGIQAIAVSDLTIEHNNFSDVNTGIYGMMGVNNGTVEHNTIESYVFGIFSFLWKGSFWNVHHNDIRIMSPGGTGIMTVGGNGWNISHNSLAGPGLSSGIVLGTSSKVDRPVNNTIEFNQIEGSANGVLGIALYGQDGALVGNNRIFMPSSSEPVGVCGPRSIDVGFSLYSLTSNNLKIMNNDTRGTAVGVFVLLDSLGGTGNSIGNELYGNFGTYAINKSSDSCETQEMTGEVTDRSKSSLISCDEYGTCTEAP